MTVPCMGISQPKDDNRLASDNAIISDEEKGLKNKLVEFLTWIKLIDIPK